MIRPDKVNLSFSEILHMSLIISAPKEPATGSFFRMRWQPKMGHSTTVPHNFMKMLLTTPKRR
jgi:hypothetical protein